MVLPTYRGSITGGRAVLCGVCRQREATQFAEETVWVRQRSVGSTEVGDWQQMFMDNERPGSPKKEADERMQLASSEG